jgi:2-dehydro-3-deoxyphosphogluconate aldolase / (4S)-4-hydroxy-2-oxoglutarate aldolase
MNRESVVEKIETEKIIPVIRTNSAKTARENIELILGGGLNILEITTSVPGVFELIRDYAQNFSDLLVGAGTVLDKETAAAAIEAGAEFIVSPVFDPDLIGVCNAGEVTVISGAGTPTEVHNAWKSGADFVKVFPVSAFGGSSYIKALRSVFPEIRLIPTGGITVENAGDFLRAGAKALGIGGNLTKGSPPEIKQNCEMLRGVLRNA